MREIKFRIWDNYPIKDGFKGLMINMDYAIQSNYLVSALKGNYPIMQYTGEKDIKGNDIYEGDILKSVEFIDWNWIQKITNIYRVIYQHGSFQYDPIPKGNYTISMIGCKVEIIGNIYQNTELLKY